MALVVLAIGSLELKTSLAPQEVYGGLAIVFLHLVAIVLICLEFNMVVVSWCDSDNVIKMVP